MRNKPVKMKINRLLATYNGKKMEKYENLARALFISVRTVIYLKDGTRMANVHLANSIDRLLEDRT